MDIKKTIWLILGFVVVIQAGAYLTEIVKKQVASSLHYESRYIPCLGRSRYLSFEMDKTYDHIMKAHQNDRTQAKKSVEWQQMMQKSEQNRAMIELSGMGFTFIVSITGLSIFFYRRRKKYTMQMPDWVGLLFGLFFMRDLVLNASYFGLVILCDEARLWTYFNLPVFPSVTVLTILLTALFLFIFYSIPRESKMVFLGSGFIGSILGLYLWFAFLSKALLL